MKPRDVGLLLALGAMWGSSFLLIKVAVAEVEPAFVVACRLFFALPYLVISWGRSSCRAGPPPY